MQLIDWSYWIRYASLSIFFLVLVLVLRSLIDRLFISLFSLEPRINKSKNERH